MGYRGKVAQQERARELRLQGMPLADIAQELGVSKSSVSLWVRDLGVEVRRRTPGPPRSNRLRERKLAEIDEMNALGLERMGELSEQAFLAAGAALYAGEGGKTKAMVLFANSDPAMMSFFLRWLRSFFDIDESRLRCRLYLHEGLDLDESTTFWSGVLGIPTSQFTKPYRAVPDVSIRHNKHEHGCPRVTYACSRTHRAVMGLTRALLSSTPAIPG
ncbi:MAG TPA: hypothetical protein VM345_16875 [Acidimicrobiales bacterium]|jgi:AcrR family transcriptional regulator|nr:hypothetical protein [Acidimicrobiales bacterium]